MLIKSVNNINQYERFISNCDTSSFMKSRSISSKNIIMPLCKYVILEENNVLTELAMKTFQFSFFAICSLQQCSSPKDRVDWGLGEGRQQPHLPHGAGGLDPQAAEQV